MNRRSGGYAIGGSNAGSNIIWSNGQRDPWHGGGFLRQSDALPGGAVFVMSSTAHHQDLRAPSPNDPAELVVVRKKEEALIRRWIQEYRPSRRGKPEVDLGRSHREAGWEDPRS